jgi:hypothetical protein
MTVRISNYETSCTYGEKTVILMKVKSCNVLLHMLLVSILSYLKSVLRYTFLIFLYLREKGCEDPR